MEELKEQIQKKKEEEVRKSDRKRIKRVVATQFEDEEDENTQVNTDSDDDDDAACIYCNELYKESLPRATWIRCQLCHKWSHTECAGLPQRAKNFVCELCR